MASLRPHDAWGCGIHLATCPHLLWGCRAPEAWLRAAWPPSFDKVTSLWIYTDEPPSTPAVQGAKLGIAMLGESRPPTGALGMDFSLFGKCSGPTLCSPPWALLKDRLGTEVNRKVKWYKQIVPSFPSEPLWSLSHCFILFWKIFMFK